MKLHAQVDWQRRAANRRHHSVTHLLHTALRQKLGDHLTQKGSLVAPDRLRFDFSHFEAISPKTLEEIETQVNAWILENQPANIQLMSLDEAKKLGAMALFGEKYGDTVRVMDIGPHSRELCGGTHVSRTGDIGSFRIISEGPLAAGVRRIEAVAGEAAVAYAQREHAQLVSVARLLSVAPAAIEQRIGSLNDELRSTKQELEKFKAKESSQLASQWASEAQTIHGIQIFAKKLSGVSPEVLQGYADELRNHMKSGIVVLGLQTGPEACQILVAITKDLAGKYHAGQMVAKLAAELGGKGGGRPDFARAGGTKPDKLDDVLRNIAQFITG
jgi:alanyl-tRNA synthetase